MNWLAVESIVCPVVDCAPCFGDDPLFVTVVICTWNRSVLLDQTLEHLGSLIIPEGVEWEVLVVNNNCTDNTDEVIAKHAKNLPVHGLREPRSGKCHAANLAVASARGELILWTDDDALVDPHWISAYVEAAKQWPDASFFGGTVDPLFAVEPPQWVKRNLAQLHGPFAIRQLDDRVRPLADEERPFGVNMAIRSKVLTPGCFDVRIGPRERDRIGGEDVALISDLMQKGEKGVWVGTARVRHYIPAERLTKQYVWGWFYGFGATEVRLGYHSPFKTWFGIPRWMLRRYVSSTLKLSINAPRENAQWLAAFQTKAKIAGMMSEFKTRGKAIQHEPRDST